MAWTDSAAIAGAAMAKATALKAMEEKIVFVHPALQESWG
jgi:ABC-type sugar transport system substrate-binding protein